MSIIGTHIDLNWSRNTVSHKNLLSEFLVYHCCMKKKKKLLLHKYLKALLCLLSCVYFCLPISFCILRCFNFCAHLGLLRIVIYWETMGMEIRNLYNLTEKKSNKICIFGLKYLSHFFFFFSFSEESSKLSKAETIQWITYADLDHLFCAFTCQQITQQPHMVELQLSLQSGSLRRKMKA